MKRLLAVLLALLALGSVANADSTGTTYRTGGGATIPGSALLVPLTAGIDTNGNPLYGPPSSTNPLAITCISGCSSAAQVIPAAPDISTVTTGGIAVIAFSATHCAKGCYIQNPDNATQLLCGNGVSTASGIHSNGATLCVVAGQTLYFPPRSGAISVVSSDSSHPFGGEGYQ